MKDYSSVDVPNPQVSDKLDSERFIPYGGGTQKNYRRASVAVLVLFLIGLLFVVAVLILNSLKIKSVNVLGNSYYNEDELRAAAGIGSDSRFLRLDEREMEESIIASCPRVETVSVKKIFPGTVTVTVTENKLEYYFEYNSRFYSLTDSLKVVEESKQSERFELYGLIYLKLPDILSVKIGVVPEFPSDKSYSYVEEFLSALSQAPHSFASPDRISSIDLLSKFAISVTLKNGSRIEFGKAEQLTEKMSLAQTLINDASEHGNVPFRFNVTKANEGWYRALTEENVTD